MTDKHESNLWILNFDGTEHSAPTSGNYDDSSPRWSPDGTRIAYVSDRDGKPRIYVRWMESGRAELEDINDALAIGRNLRVRDVLEVEDV